MNKLASKQFWVATAERAIKTIAQVAVAFIGTGLVGIAGGRLVTSGERVGRSRAGIGSDFVRWLRLTRKGR